MSVLHFLRGRTRLVASLVLLACVASLAIGCSKKSKKPVEPEVPVPPTPSSPQKVISLLEWCWDQRDNTVYSGVFTDDFRYEFAPSDLQPAGLGLDRDQELLMAARLFVSGATGHPAATSISLGFDPTLLVLPDDRPGRPGPWHKRINTSVRLIVNTPGPDYSLTGTAVFYVTRGDSARIPPIPGRSFTPDSTIWYVDHWIDNTVCPPGKSCVTTGRLKLDYEAAPAAASAAR